MFFQALKKGVKKVLRGPKGIVDSVREFGTRARLNPVGAAMGMNYCGPGTKLEGQKARNQTDKICKSHDYDYNRINQMAARGASKEAQKKAVRKADKAMLDRLDRDVSLKDKLSVGYAVSKGGIWLKNRLEDVGLLDPLKFAGGKNKSHTPGVAEQEGDYTSSLTGDSLESEDRSPGIRTRRSNAIIYQPNRPILE